MGSKPKVLPALTPAKQFLYAGGRSFTFVVALADRVLVIWHRRNFWHRAQVRIADFGMREFVD